MVVVTTITDATPASFVAHDASRGNAENIAKDLLKSGIDLFIGGHDNDAAVLVDEVLDFDEAVGEALDFAQKDGHTLVVITADHETGGVTIVGGNINSHKVQLNFSSKAHTAVMVPVFAFGPQAEKFTGIYDNTMFIGKFLGGYGFNH
jgi:alkaline phosphatase